MEPFFPTVWGPLLAGHLLNIKHAVHRGTQAWGTLGLTFQDLSNSELRCEGDGLSQWLLVTWRGRQERAHGLLYGWGNWAFVACTRSHSSLVVFQADARAVPPPQSGAAQAALQTHASPLPQVSTALEAD